MSCDKTRERIKKRTNAISKASGRFNSQYLMGVGSTIKYITVTRYKLAGCNRCHATSIEMDQKTPEEIEENLEYWANELHENAMSQRFIRLLAFVAHKKYGLSKYIELIVEAIQLHRAEVSRKYPPQEG